MYALRIFSAVKNSPSTVLLNGALPLVGVCLGSTSTSVTRLTHDVTSIPSSLSGQSQAAQFSNSLSFSRSLASSSLDVSLPSTRHQFVDLHFVDLLLPNRRSLSPQFSPHGIMLVPKSILEPPPDDIDQEDRGMHAIGIKKWRKLKMKNHKVARRRKMNSLPVFDSLIGVATPTQPIGAAPVEQANIKRITPSKTAQALRPRTPEFCALGPPKVCSLGPEPQLRSQHRLLPLTTSALHQHYASMPSKEPRPKRPPGASGWEFKDHHIRPNVFYWSPDAYQERQEVQSRRKVALGTYKDAMFDLEDLNQERQEVQSRRKVALETYNDAMFDLEDVTLDVNQERQEVQSRRKVALETYKDAMDKVENEKYEEAESLLEIAIAAWPDNPKFLSALAVTICDHRQDPDRSLPWFDAAIDMNDNPTYRAQRAQALAYMGALDEALQDCGSAIAGDSLNGIYVRSRAMIFERKGMFFEAINDYSHAVPLLKAVGNPIFECIFNRGYCHKLMGHLEEAVKDFEAANNLAPFSVTVKMVLGGMHLQKKRYHNALTFFSAAKFSADLSPAVYYNLGLTQYTMAQDPYSMKDDVMAGADEDEGDTPRDGDESSDTDDDDDWEERLPPSTGGSKDRNKNPKQWAIDNIQGEATNAKMNLEKRVLLDQALVNFNKALELYNHQRDTADPIKPAGATPHIPGTPVVHDEEVEDGEIQYSRGLANLALGSLEAAEADFHDALRANPTHAHFPHYRAVVLAKKGELKEAVKWNMNALHLNRHYYPALYHLGLILHILMRNAEAIQRLDMGREIHPTFWKIMEARDAINALQQALRQVTMENEGSPPLLARMHFAIAQSAIVTHRRDLLRSSLKEAQLNGQDPASMFSLRGLLAHREKKCDKAIKYMSRAIKIAPQEARFLFDRSQVYLERKDFNLAIEDMTHALERLPDCPSLFYFRGMAHFSMDNEELALKDFEKAASTLLNTEDGSGEAGSKAGSPALITDAPNSNSNSNGPPALITDARLWEGSKVKSTGTAPPDLSASLWYHLGCMRARSGMAAPAAQAFEHAAQLLPSHPAVLHELAKIYQAFEHAAQLLPSHPAVLHELAKIYQELGEVDKGLKTFDKVLKLQPNNANALFRRGLMHHTMRQYEAAAADMQRARKVEPSNPAFQVDYLRMGNMRLVELCKPGCESAIYGGAEL
eukprot:gene26959-35001_t